MGSEDAACNRLTELALNDVSFAGSILAEAVGSSEFAVAAVADPAAHEAFQRVCSLNALRPMTSRCPLIFARAWSEGGAQHMSTLPKHTEGGWHVCVWLSWHVAGMVERPQKEVDIGPSIHAVLYVLIV